MENKYVQAILRGMKPCVIGIVLATGIYMILKNCFHVGGDFTVDGRACIVLLVLVISMNAYKKWKKKKLSPILMIVLSALAGMVVYAL